MIDVPERLEGVIDNNGLISLAWYITEAVRLHLTGEPCRDTKSVLCHEGKVAATTQSCCTDSKD